MPPAGLVTQVLLCEISKPEMTEMEEELNKCGLLWKGVHICVEAAHLHAGGQMASPHMNPSHNETVKGKKGRRLLLFKVKLCFSSHLSQNPEFILGNTHFERLNLAKSGKDIRNF